MLVNKIGKNLTLYLKTKNMNRLLTVAIVSSIALLYSCKTQKQVVEQKAKTAVEKSEPAPQKEPKMKEDFSDVDGKWNLEAMIVNDISVEIPAKTLKPIKLTIRKAILDPSSITPANAMIGGTGPVNGFGMEAKMMDDGTINAEVLNQTAMADVRNEVNQFEKQYFMIFENAHKYWIKDGKLYLASAHAELVFAKSTE